MDPVHFVLEVVQTLPAAPFAGNQRGCGSAQYPPSMLLALLIYCYSMGLFSSRKIEQATHRDIGVRYLTGDTHPDHDTICAFRRNNKAAIEACFMDLLVYAKELGLAKVGTVSVDGTHLKANAAKDRNITHERALAKVPLEWDLVALAYNVKRLFNLKAALDSATHANGSLQHA